MSVMLSRQDMEDRVTELRVWRVKKAEDRIRIAHEIGRKMAKVDRTNPVAFNYTVSSLLNNAAVPEDFEDRIKRVA